MANGLRAAEAQDFLAVAHEAAEAARTATLPYFRAPALAVDDKGGAGFDPVTEADRAGERAIRGVLSRRCPADGIVGEEYAPREGRSGRTWVVDPIDGTRSFVAGFPLWTVLIALHDGVRPVVGLIDQPYLDERYWGVTATDGHEAGYARRGETGDLRTRRCGALRDAVIATTGRDAFAAPADYEAYRGLEVRCRFSRQGGDAYQYAMMAEGRVDLVVESGLDNYDAMALVPVVVGAGGVVTDWTGADRAGDGGRVLAAGDAALHAKAMDALRI